MVSIEENVVKWKVGSYKKGWGNGLFMNVKKYVWSVKLKKVGYKIVYIVIGFNYVKIDI